MAALTTLLHLSTLVICATWVLPVCLAATSAVTVHSWCYTEQTYKTISCTDKDSVISVVRAFAGMGRHPQSNFCQFPSPSADDCLLSQAAKTDFYRRQCNTFNTCTFYVDNPPIESCGAEYGGRMYLLIEHTCQPVRDGDGRHFPILDACSPDVIPVEAPSVMLYNDNYPTNDRPVEACSLIVWSRTPIGYPTNITHFKVTFRDLAHSEIDNLACPYSLQYGTRGERMCARRGAPYMTVRVESGSQLQFHTRGYQPLGRFWLQITADVEGGTIIVQHMPAPGTQPAQPVVYPTYPTPTTTKPTPTTAQTVRPTTPTPTTRPTTRPTPTTTASGVKWPTIVTHVGTEDHVTDEVTMRFPPGGSTVQDSSTRGRGGPVVIGLSTRGQQEVGAEAEELTTLAPPSEEAVVGMGIKIIVGGAVAGAVIVLLVVVCVAICVRRKKKPVKRRPDLGYSVHANIAIANKLHNNAGSLRHPVSPQPKTRSSTVAITSPEYMNTGGGPHPPPLPTGGAPIHVGVDHLRSVALRHSSRPTYKNADDRKSQNRKSRHRKSASQTTLMAGFGESSDSLDIAPKAGDPYAVSGIFAGFPRWADNPRLSGADDQYDMFTSTLPAQLNKKPMPLPKPLRSPSRSSLRLSPSTSPTPLSSLSLDQPDFGTTRSTDALYAVPNKKNKRKSKDAVIVENELYVNSRRF